MDSNVVPSIVDNILESVVPCKRRLPLISQSCTHLSAQADFGCCSGMSIERWPDGRVRGAIGTTSQQRKTSYLFLQL